MEAVGKNVKEFRRGDEVFGDLSQCGLGAFAEYIAVSEAELVALLGPLLSLTGGQKLTNLYMTVFVFGIGALIFYSLLYQSNLIPRWLSVWGFIAIVLHLTTGMLIVFGLQNEFSALNSIMNLPIFLQEMAMAVWLIAKGFTPSAVVSPFAKQ